jgi:hypothetical protein
LLRRTGGAFLLFAAATGLTAPHPNPLPASGERELAVQVVISVLSSVAATSLLAAVAGLITPHPSPLPASEERELAVRVVISVLSSVAGTSLLAAVPGLIAPLPNPLPASGERELAVWVVVSVLSTAAVIQATRLRYSRHLIPIRALWRVWIREQKASGLEASF